LVVSAPVLCDPVVGFEPDQAPEAAQEVAWLEDQFSVDAPPLATVLGLTDKLTVGVGAVTVTVTDCVALPPLPVQVSE
jgi:hypothetical protein